MFPEFSFSNLATIKIYQSHNKYHHYWNLKNSISSAPHQVNLTHMYSEVE